MAKIPVILDTDIGSDIDDAVALAYLLRQECCELLGVTTVSGEPDKRASLVTAVLAAAGRDDVSVHVGAPDPLLVTQHQGSAAQFEALSQGWAHRSFGIEPDAIEFLRKTIRSRPGEVTLLAVGPLTNIGLLFKVDPEIPMLLRRLVIMGGQFFMPRPDSPEAKGEWNIQCDPHAAQIVFAAPLAELTAIGLDVSLQCVMPEDECRARFKAAGGPLGPVSAMTEVWARHSKMVTFHDPLAATVIFKPELCKMTSGEINVDLRCEKPGGITLFDPSESGAHHVAQTVDVRAFFDHYFEVTGK